MLSEKNLPVLKNSAFLTRFSDDEIAHSVSAFDLDKKHFSKDETIFSSGEKIFSLRIVLSRAVHIQQLDWWGNLKLSLARFLARHSPL